MFGYVMVNRKDLSPEQLRQYQACYCGLCRTLGQRYGLPGRAALTYDMTFLVLLLTSLYEPEKHWGSQRCAPHPAKPHPYWQSAATGYAADMNVALAYYSCLDNWQDDHSLPGLAQAQLLKKHCAALRERYPRQLRAAEYYLGQLARLEKERAAGLDAAPGCFGALLGELFAPRADRWSVPLRQMGSALGKFIYILDAYVDLEKDRRSGSYNPLLALDRAGLDSCCLELLTMLAAECAGQFELLPVVEDAGLLRNILYSGIWTRFNAAQKQNQPGRGDRRRPAKGEPA